LTLRDPAFSNSQAGASGSSELANLKSAPSLTTATMPRRCLPCLSVCAVFADRFSGGTSLSLRREWFVRHALRKLRDVAPNAAQELSRTKKPGCLALKTSDALACRFCGGCGGLLLLTRPGSRLPGALAAVRVPDALRQSLLERLTRCVFQNFLQEFADDSAGLRWRIAERIHSASTRHFTTTCCNAHCDSKRQRCSFRQVPGVRLKSCEHPHVCFSDR
jgi:hypothetical protein